MLFYGFWYNPMGELAKWRAARGHDYTGIVKTQWDDQIPVVVPFIVPYFLVYLQPLVYVAICISSKGLRASLPFLRKFHSTQFTLMTAAYIMYVLFPVSISSIMYPFPENGTFLDKYTWTFVKNGMSDFCACPSMHVAHVLSMSLIHRHDGLPGSSVAMAFAFCTLFSTVFTRAHYIMDVPCGVALAFAVDRLLFKSLTSKRTRLDKPDGGLSRQGRIALCIAIPTCVFLGSEILGRWTNARVDMFGMLAGTVKKAEGVL